jgi:hypothetical protein
MIPVVTNEWVELVGKVIVLVTVVVGAREGRKAHKRGLMNTELINEVKAEANGHEPSPPTGTPLPR